MSNRTDFSAAVPWAGAAKEPLATRHAPCATATATAARCKATGPVPMADTLSPELPPDARLYAYLMSQPAVKEGDARTGTALPFNIPGR